MRWWRPAPATRRKATPGSRPRSPPASWPPLRYSLAYQFGQGGGIQPTLVHVVLIGVTGSVKNTPQAVRPLPTRGRRVDGSDGVGFPVVEDVPTQ